MAPSQDDGSRRSGAVPETDDPATRKTVSPPAVNLLGWGILKRLALVLAILACVWLGVLWALA